MRLNEILGVNVEEFEALAKFTLEQRAYLKALSNIDRAGPHSSNDVEKLAVATYGVAFNEKNLPKQVLYPLRDAGYIDLERGTREAGRDPFAGSCVTGEVCERIERRWTCIEIIRDYCKAAVGRFVRDPQKTAKPVTDPNSPSNYYRLARPGILWNGDHGESLARDGGEKRQPKPKADPTGNPRRDSLDRVSVTT